MIVGVVGSRKFHDLERVWVYVNGLPEDTIIVSGGAVGVDLAAEGASRARGWAPIILRPDYRRYGRYDAPKNRNTLIARLVDRLVAFWDGESGGTKDTIDKVRALGKDVEVFQ